MFSLPRCSLLLLAGLLAACAGAPSTTPLADRGQTTRLKAAQHFRECRTQLALAEYRKVLYLAELRDDHRDIATALLNLGTIQLVRGEYAEAEAQLQQAQSRFEQLGDGDATLQAGIGLATLRVKQGRAAEGLDGYRRLQQRFDQKKGHLPLLQVMLWNGTASAHKELADYAQAHAALDRAEELLAGMEAPRDLAATWMNRARIHFQQGDLQKAKQAAVQALAKDRGTENSLGIGTDLLLLGMIAERQGAPAQARQHLRQAASLFDYCGLERKRFFSAEQLRLLDKTAR
ncbi:MAG: tetratricopeptide repeat protein [Magnetococcus sp. MYC-9]